MQFPPVRKDVATLAVRPNLVDYPAACAGFSWNAVRAELAGLPGGGLNIAHEAVDRHAAGPLAHRVAVRLLGRDDTVHDLTYTALKEESSRFANLLHSLGLLPGERVFWLAGRSLELYAVFFGALKCRAVFCPLFAAFGPEPISQRLGRGNARVLVTTTRQYDRKIKALIDTLPELDHILLVDAQTHVNERVRSLPRLMAEAAPDFPIPPTDPEDPAILHFTSGTTGLPKGAVHVHQAVLTHFFTGRYVLDLHPQDIFWCTADPGWVTGTSYGIIAPLVHGVTTIVDEADFDAERWYQILQDQRVTVWYTAPTAIRRAHARARGAAPALRSVRPAARAQRGRAAQPGGRGLGRAGARPAHPRQLVADRDRRHHDRQLRGPGHPPRLHGAAPAGHRGGHRHPAGGRLGAGRGDEVQGELALKSGWPSMFRAYLHDEARYQKCFIPPWYLTGDLARRDADGYYWFVGRADDIIKTAGHMVGPFEVESSLMEHPAVAEAGVIGKPDAMIGELVKAFVVLKPGHEAGETLRQELIGFGRTRLGSAVAPREIDFIDNLPKTRSGKIMRRLLKARELGLPIGDTSTLEGSEPT